MTGPGHYKEAERLMSLEPHQRTENGEPDNPAILALMAEAQVHATLALAAAVVDGPAVMRPEDRDEWDRVTGRSEVTP
jgi:hypothetical protein